MAGQKKIKMEHLKRVYESKGFENVITYIQSGNVVFKSALQQDKISSSLEEAIKAEFGFEVPVIVRSLDEWIKICDKNPFIKNGELEEGNQYVAILNKVPEKSAIEHALAFDFINDSFSIEGREVYIWYASKFSDSKLDNKFLESKLKVVSTMRNWNTMNKLKELALSL